MKKIKQFIQNTDNIFLKTLYKYYIIVRVKLRAFLVSIIYCLFGILPKHNKIIATTFNGKKYGDNSKFIVEELHKMNPSLDIVWMSDDSYNYNVPSYVRKVPLYNHPYKKAYEYSTAKAWIDTHRLVQGIKKSKNQMFIETWHGGIAIKKLDGDVPKFRANKSIMEQL